MTSNGMTRQPGGRVSSENDGQRATIARKFQKYCHLEWPGWTRITIWTMLVAPLTVLTVRELILNESEYLYNNVSPQLEVVSSNETVDPPPLTVCFPYYSGSLYRVFKWLYDEELWQPPIGALSSALCPECEGMKNNSWDVWTRVDWQLGAPYLDPNFTSKLTNALIIKLLKDGGDFPSLTLNKTNFNWNQPIVDAVWLFLSCLFKQDRDYIMGKTEISWELDDCENYTFTEIGYIPDATIDRLFELVVDAVSVYTSFMYRIEPGIWSSQRMKEISGFVPFGAKFCFPFPHSIAVEFQYTNYEQVIDPPWKRSMADAQAWKVIRRVEFYKGNSSYSYYLNEDYMLPLATLYADNNGHYRLSLAYTIENQVDARRPDRTCSKEDFYICLGKCRYNRVTTECKCVPFSLRHLRPGTIKLPYCNKTLYQSCDKGMLHRRQVDKADVTNCFDDKCEYIFYKWDRSDRIVAADDLSFDLRVRYNQAPFVKSTFVLKMTVQQFLAQAGGTLNLYLGISGLSLLSLLVFIIDLNRHCRQRRESLARTARDWQGLQGNVFLNLPFLLSSFLVTPRGDNDDNQTRIEINGSTSRIEDSKNIDDMDMDELENHLRKILIQIERRKILTPVDELEQLESQGDRSKSTMQPVREDPAHEFTKL